MKMVVVASQPISFSTPHPNPNNPNPIPNPKNPIATAFLQSRRNRSLRCHCATSSLHWDWNRWTHHFSHIQHVEALASVLQFQLEDAIENQDFREAARLKRAIAEVSSDDTVAEIMSLLKNALDDERYRDASRLCRYTGSGLLGWWVAYSKDSDDHFGKIIHISPAMGRYVGKSYSPRQLITASPGTPIFEIYVVKNADDTYHLQVVYLRRGKGNSVTSSPSIPAKSTFKPEVQNDSSVEMQEHEEKAETYDVINSNIEEATEEGIKSVINFLKDKLPGLKMKVTNISVEVDGAEDKDPIKQLMQEDSNKTGTSEDPDNGVNDLDEHDEVTLEADNDTSVEGKDSDMKLFVGGVVHNDDNTSAKDEFMRLPAEIHDMERDSFVLYIPRRNLDYDTRQHKVPNIKLAALAAQAVSDLMPFDIANTFWGSDKVSSKVSKNVREIVQLVMSQARKRSRLSEYTSFSRITSSRGDLDPFDGLYVGVFGPYGTEVVQLKRKFGHWNGVGNENNPSDVEFFEYVESVKLTGDLNVPAGQVTFRAKIGRGNRNNNRGKFPNELGVVASYKGQGRTAELGFRNPSWVDGELLVLNGLGIGPNMKGADIGFLYADPQQSFLVLFNRLKLPE